MSRGARGARRFLADVVFVMTLPALLLIAVLAETLGELEEP